MEKRIEQKTVLTNVKKTESFKKESAFSLDTTSQTQTTENTGKGMFLSPQDAEEYRAYKRRKKVEEIMAAIAKSEASLLNGEDPQRVCERAIRLKQAAIKVPPSWLPQAKNYLGGSRVKIDCVIGGNGETLTRVKAYETRVALRGGAKEFTVVLAPSLLRHNKFSELKKEMKKLCRVAKNATVKVWINSDYPFTTLSKVARLCCEVGVKYLCVPYFAGCEKLRFDLTNGCQIEVSEVETLSEYRRLCEAGVGRIVTRNIWDIYSEWMKEADRIQEEGALPTTQSSTTSPAVSPTTMTVAQPATPPITSISSSPAVMPQNVQPQALTSAKENGSMQSFEKVEKNTANQDQEKAKEEKSEETLHEKIKPLFVKNTSCVENVEKQEEKAVGKIKDTTCETKKEMRTFLEGSDLKFL